MTTTTKVRNVRAENVRKGDWFCAQVVNGSLIEGFAPDADALPMKPGGVANGLVVLYSGVGCAPLFLARDDLVAVERTYEPKTAVLNDAEMLLDSLAKAKESTLTERVRAVVDSRTQAYLDAPPRTRTVYYVPGSGRGTTVSKIEAQKWATRGGRNLPVLTRTETFTTWEVAK